MLFIGSPFFLSVGHVCLNCWEINKLSPFPFPSFVYPFCLFFSAFPYHLDPSLPGSLASLQALKRSAKGLDTAYKLWPCSCLSLRCQELDLRIVLVPPTLIPPSGSDAFFHELTGSSISDQRFMLPFITVALVSHSLGAGKHPYKPAAPFMREQTPKSLPLARFCLCDLHPHTLEKAVVTLARKVDTDGREHGIGPAGSL